MTEDKAIACDACGFTYFHNAAAAAAAIVQTPLGVLFVRRARNPGKGMLDLPGGFADYGESITDALRRELREELGVDIAEFEFVTSRANRYVYREVTYLTTDMFFRCHVSNPDSFRPNEESTELVYRTPGTVRAGELAFESSREVLAGMGFLSQSEVT